VSFFTFTATNVPGTTAYRVVVKNLAFSTPGVTSAFDITVLADSDGDGLPDNWENAFALNPASSSDRNLDSDGDGFTNWQEYQAGTDPSDAASYLSLSLDALSGGAQVQFNAASNKTYSVLYSHEATSGMWMKLTDVLARTNSRVESVIDPNWTWSRFYRLATPRQP
jgi:hypothetical protein